MDANALVGRISYLLTDTAFTFPITPSTTLSDKADSLRAAGAKNLYNALPSIMQMESEGGSAGALHGSLRTGSLTTTYSSSQGLLLMIPAFYKLAGEHLPGVIHVAARSIATSALSIHGDHSDIAAIRCTGVAIIGSESAASCQHSAIISHVAAVLAQHPVVHFIDGFRTSHAMESISELTLDEIRDFIGFICRAAFKEVPELNELYSAQECKSPYDLYLTAVEAFRQRGSNPAYAVATGSCQGPDIFFAGAEGNNPHENMVSRIMQALMNAGARYKGAIKCGGPTSDFYTTVDVGSVAYYGPKTGALTAIIANGSGAAVIRAALSIVYNHNPVNKANHACLAAIRKLNPCLIAINLIRPFPIDALNAALPATVHTVTVLDRSRVGIGSGGIGPGIVGEMWKEVVASLFECGRIGTGDTSLSQIHRGRYGLSCCDFTPEHALSIMQNMAIPGVGKPHTRHEFTVGIADDVSDLGLPEFHLNDYRVLFPEGTFQAIFWGFGSDGTVSSVRSLARALTSVRGGQTAVQDDTTTKEQFGFQVQSHFEYDSFKSGGLTMAHLRVYPSRFGEGCDTPSQPPDVPFLVTRPSLITISEPTYLRRFHENLVPPHLKHIAQMCAKGQKQPPEDGERPVFLINTPARTAADFFKLIPANLRQLFFPAELSTGEELPFKIVLMDASALSVETSVPVSMAMLGGAVQSFTDIAIATGLAPKDLDVGDILVKSVGDTFRRLGPVVVERNEKCLRTALDPKFLFEMNEMPDIASFDGLLQGQNPEEISFFSDVYTWNRNELIKRSLEMSTPFGVPPPPICDDMLPKLHDTTLLNAHKSSTIPSDGVLPSAGSNRIVLRAITKQVPRWNPSSCVQCTMCVASCPHDVCAAYVWNRADNEETSTDGIRSARLRYGQTAGAALEKEPGQRFTIHISQLQCTGCGVCTTVCPTSAKGTLVMVDAASDAGDVKTEEIGETLKGVTIMQKAERITRMLEAGWTLEEVDRRVLIADADETAEADRLRQTGASIVPRNPPRGYLVQEMVNKYQLSERAKLEESGPFKRGVPPNIMLPYLMLYPAPFSFAGGCSGCGELPYVSMLARIMSTSFSYASMDFEDLIVGKLPGELEPTMPFGISDMGRPPVRLPPLIEPLPQYPASRLIIANATGCSSIYGFSWPWTPFNKGIGDRSVVWNEDGTYANGICAENYVRSELATEDAKRQPIGGYGIPWSNSLFENAAEFGYGMTVSLFHRRLNALFAMHGLYKTVTDYLVKHTGEPTATHIVLLNKLMDTFRTIARPDVWTDGPASLRAAEIIDGWRRSFMVENPSVLSAVPEGVMDALREFFLPSILSHLPQWSSWTVGGDGWAYDIGSAGIKHLVSRTTTPPIKQFLSSIPVPAEGITPLPIPYPRRLNIRVLVLDNELYSNTGGQASTATPPCSFLAMTRSGTPATQSRFPLPATLVGLSTVYVASISIDTHAQQATRAFLEADAYPGPAFIFAQSPCIEQGVRLGAGGPLNVSDRVAMVKAGVKCGYIQAFRYDPRGREVGVGRLGGMVFDSKEPTDADLNEAPKYVGFQRRWKNPSVAPDEQKRQLAETAEIIKAEIRERWYILKKSAGVQV